MMPYSLLANALAADKLFTVLNIHDGLTKGDKLWMQRYGSYIDRLLDVLESLTDADKAEVVKLARVRYNSVLVQTKDRFTAQVWLEVEKCWTD